MPFPFSEQIECVTQLFFGHLAPIWSPSEKTTLATDRTASILSPHHSDLVLSLHVTASPKLVSPLVGICPAHDVDNSATLETPLEHILHFDTVQHLPTTVGESFGQPPITTALWLLNCLGWLPEQWFKSANTPLLSQCSTFFLVLNCRNVHPNVASGILGCGSLPSPHVFGFQSLASLCGVPPNRPPQLLDRSSQCLQHTRSGPCRRIQSTNSTLGRPCSRKTPPTTTARSTLTTGGGEFLLGCRPM